MKLTIQFKARQARTDHVVVILLVAFSFPACSGGDVDIETLNATSDFAVADQVANEYLAVTVKITESDIKPVKSKLVRGPSKANSALADLKISALVGDRLIMSYVVQDPRFSSREAAGWVASPSGETIVFVPLSSVIDSVVIRPVTGREDLVSNGGQFDPRPWAISACQNVTAKFAACPEIIALIQTIFLVPP